jgi:hypothetical protein
MDANSRNTDSSHHHDRTHRTQETPTPATGQAPLHAQSGRETPPARGQGRSAPFVVRVGLEAARSYPARQRASRDTIRNDLWLYGNAYVTTDGERIDPTTLVIYSNPCRTVDLYP